MGERLHNYTCGRAISVCGGCLRACDVFTQPSFGTMRLFESLCSDQMSLCVCVYIRIWMESSLIVNTGGLKVWVCV